MNIDIEITFDDLSDEAKKKIHDLEAQGFRVQLKYPKIAPADDGWGHPIYPQWPAPPPIMCNTSNSGSELPKPGIQVYCKSGE